jgi:hypothetical protein
MGAKFNVALNQYQDNLIQAVVGFNSLGDNVVVPGIKHLYIRIYKLFFIPQSATSITFKSGQTAQSGPVPFTAFQGAIFDFDTKPWFTTLAGDDWIMNLSIGVLLAGTVWYTQER